LKIAGCQKICFVYRSPRPQLPFNEVDKSECIDRRSYLMYHVDNQVPQNPVGRTGIVGRGILPRWGPNHASLTVVTR